VIVATYHVLYWKDIPSMVEATDPAGTVKVQLSDQFQVLIDAVAMKLGLAGTDEYLEQWEHGDEQERAGSAHDVANAVAKELESEFVELRARTLGRP